MLANAGKIKRTAFAGTVRCEVVVCTSVLSPTNGTAIILGVPPVGLSVRFRAIFSTSREKLLLIGLMSRIFGACPATTRTRSLFAPAGRGTDGPRADRCYSCSRSSARSPIRAAIRAGCSGKDGAAGQAQAVKAGKGVGGLGGAAGSMPAAGARRSRLRFRARTSGRSSGASASAAAAWW